jgi:hypothetical protein
LCKLAFFGKVATGVISSIPLALMQALRCPHCRRCLGAIAIITIVALASLRTSLWQTCGLPFTGINARLLVVHSSESIFSIALTLAPAPTAVRPAFTADGTHPLVSAFLADLWVCVTPSKAGSSLSSKTLPALFFCHQLSWCHHPGKSYAGAGVRLQCTSTFVTERTAPAP